MNHWTIKTYNGFPTFVTETAPSPPQLIDGKMHVTFADLLKHIKSLPEPTGQGA